jgi:hypothetical protein
LLKKNDEFCDFQCHRIDSNLNKNNNNSKQIRNDYSHFFNDTVAINDRQFVDINLNSPYNLFDAKEEKANEMNDFNNVTNLFENKLTIDDHQIEEKSFMNVDKNIQNLVDITCDNKTKEDESDFESFISDFCDNPEESLLLRQKHSRLKNVIRDVETLNERFKDLKLPPKKRRKYFFSTDNKVTEPTPIETQIKRENKKQNELLKVISKKKKETKTNEFPMITKQYNLTFSDLERNNVSRKKRNQSSLIKKKKIKKKSLLRRIFICF